MTCKVCPPSQRASLKPCRARLAQSGMIQDVDGDSREPGGLSRDVEPGRRRPMRPSATSGIRWPSSSYGHHTRESRLSTLSGIVSRVRRPSRVRPDVNRPPHELFTHIVAHSVLPGVLLILGIAFLSCVIVEPYNYRQVAQDSRIVSGVWFLVGFLGAVCSYKNIKCLKYIHQVVVILECRLMRSSATLMWYLSLSVGCNICWRFTTCLSKLLWVFGPFIRYVIPG